VSNEQDKVIKPKMLRSIQIIVMLVTAFLLGAHVVKWDAIQVDTVTLTLLGLLLLIPFADLIRKIKLGEFEAEIGKEEIAKIQAKAAAELPSSTKEEFAISEEEIRDLLSTDPRLALAKIRIELEEALKRLYLASVDSQSDLRRLSLGRLVDGLVQREVLRGSVASALRDVISLANRAIHGERVEPAAAEDLALLGTRLINELKQTYLEYILKPIETAVITTEEVDQYRSAKFKVTTIVPLVDNPTKNTYVLDQDALESFIEDYQEYAEFIIAIEKI
jgi:hypothetical protein